MHQLVTPNELIMLKKYASQAKLGIVEIGVLDGGTTRELLASSTVSVYGIDPLVPDSNDPNLVGNFELVKAMLSNARFEFFREFSYDIVWKFKQPTRYRYDMDFVDGDHNSDAVKKDFEDWGDCNVIAFHDTTVVNLRTGNPGPAKFINEEMMQNKNFELIDSVDSLKIFRKIK